MAGEDRRRVLIVLSGADQVRMKNGTLLQTGYYLNELAEPLGSFHRAGYLVDCASPGRRPPRIDPFSLTFLKGERRTQALARVEAREDLKRPLALERITNDELFDYSGIYVPGGYAPMADIAGLDRMNTIFEHFHRGYKPTCLIGHGMAALIPTIPKTGPWIYRGYRMTCASDWKDGIARLVLRRLPGKTPFSIARRLKRAGGVVRQSYLPRRSFIVEDHELLTAQDPWSANRLGEVFVRKLEVYRKKEPLY